MESRGDLYDRDRVGDQVGTVLGVEQRPESLQSAMLAGDTRLSQEDFGTYGGNDMQLATIFTAAALLLLALKQASRARVASFGCASWHKANLEAAQRTMSQVARDEMACAKRTFGTFPH